MLGRFIISQIGKEGGIPLQKVVSNKISEVAKTTEAHSADMVRLSDVENSSKTRLSNMTGLKWRAQRKSKQINLTLQVKERMICLKH